MDKLQTREKLPHVRVVGIGASAGGIEAITRLLDFLPGDTGMAFVFVQHLSSGSDSSLPTILGKHTTMPIIQVEKATEVKPNQFYVIAPGTVLALKDKMLVPSPVTTGRQIGSNINTFFSSLAQAQKRQAVGVVLSGANNDGTEGIKAIKAVGGILYAQIPESAKFDAIPQSAIATALIDYVLPPDEIGEQLGRLAMTKDDEKNLFTNVELWSELMTDLKKASGIDFNSYKELTISRRVLRRMGLTKNSTLQEYIDFIKTQPGELVNLERELLINYTKFFRDETMFEHIKTKIFPELFHNILPNDTVRLWIPGCSTGEEAYSFAILLSEYLESQKLTNAIQIFGSDVDDEAVEQARLGVYPKSIREEVSPQRIRNFFVETGKGYKLTSEIRSKCIFSKQNILNDPPFSRVDLISCRNVLIYFGVNLQKQALLRFHYALKPDGFLVLGTSETTSMLADYFEPITKKDKIYRKKNVVSNVIANLFGPPSYTVRVDTKQSGGEVMPKKSRLENAVEKAVLDRYGPVGVVVDEKLEIVQLRGQTSEFLSLVPGKPSLNLLKMIREDLSLDLFHVLQQAKATKSVAKTPKIPVDGGESTVAIEVIPIRGDNAENYLLVLFEKVFAPVGQPEVDQQDDQSPAEWSKQREELAATRDYMKAVIVQYETNNEKLQAANEEAQTSNEELQTMNEELETAKEELQSTNEELITLNEELQYRNEDLHHANSDIQNVLRSIETSILMLDGNMQIRRFNAGAEKLFNLIATDIGRPIGNLRYNLRLTGFEAKVKKAVNDLAILEEEVITDDGRWYLMQIRPYRTIDNRIDGAVILFTDITSMQQSLSVAREAQALAEGIIETMPDPLVILHADLRIRSANKAFYRTIKSSRAETLNKYIYDLGSGPWNSPAIRSILDDVAARNVKVKDHRVEWQAPVDGLRTMLVNARRIFDEKVQVNLVLMVVRDITPAK